MFKRKLLYSGVILLAIAIGVVFTPNQVWALDISQNGVYRIGTNKTAEAEGIVVKAGTTVTIDLAEDLTVTGKDAIYVENGATVDITGNSTVTSVGVGYAALFNNGTTTIKSGKFTKDESKGNYYTILNHGKLTINSGSISQTNLRGSSLIANGYYDFAHTDERKGYVAGKALESPILTVNGGHFSGGIANIKNDDNGRMVINGGTFVNNGTNIHNWNIGTINGGTFTCTKPDTANVVVGKMQNYEHTAGVFQVNNGTFNGPAFVSEFPTHPMQEPLKVNGGNFNNPIFAMQGGNLTDQNGNLNGNFLKVNSGEFIDAKVKTVVNSTSHTVVTNGNNFAVLANLNNTTETMELFVDESKPINLPALTLSTLTATNSQPTIAKIINSKMTGLRAGQTTFIWTLGRNTYTLHVNVKNKPIVHAPLKKLDNTPDTGRTIDPLQALTIILVGLAITSAGIIIKRN